MAGRNDLFKRTSRGFGAEAQPPVRPEPRGRGTDELNPVRSPVQLKSYSDLTEYDLTQMPSDVMINFMMKNSLLSSAFFNAIQMGNNRQEMYREYELMEDSVLISSFLEMITDDSFQRDAEQEASVWVGETTRYQEDIEDFLYKVLDIESTGWGLIYQLAKLGDLFVKPQYQEGIGIVWARFDTYPGNVWRIDINGKLFAFAFREVGQVSGNPYNETSGETHVVDERGFVHFLVNYRPDFTRTTLVIPKSSIKDILEISGLDESTLNFSRKSTSKNAEGDIVDTDTLVSRERRDELFTKLREHRDTVLTLRERQDTELENLRINYLREKASIVENAPELLVESKTALIEAEYGRSLNEITSEYKSKEYDLNSYFLSNWDDDDQFYFTLSSKYGNSFLFAARRDYKVLNLIEQSLALGRLARSAVARVYYVNTEGAAPKERAQIMNWIETKLTQTETFDKTQNLWKSEYFPYNYLDDIFLPVTGLKGDVKMDQIGGDLDIKDIVDVDYFLNKVFSGLKIPKAYLGFEECCRSTTKVVLLDGSIPTIKEIAENQEEYIGRGILTCGRDGKITPSKIVRAGVTRLNATFVRVHLDNGKYVDVTPDHPMMMRDGTFVDAGSLQVEDSLMPYYSEIADSGAYKGYRLIKQNTKRDGRGSSQGGWTPLFRVVATDILNNGEKIEKGMLVHHKDHIKTNNDPSNLEILTRKEHYQKHKSMIDSIMAEGRVTYDVEEMKRRRAEGLRTPKVRKRLSDVGKGRKVTWGAKIGKALKGRKKPVQVGDKNPMKDPEIKQRHLEAVRKAGLKRRKRAQYDIVCEWCGKEFRTRELVPHEDIPRFCSFSCSGSSSPNHKVIRVEALDVVEDAYDIGVEHVNHTFALDAGVFVHNSLPGGIGSTTLVRLDIRYARTVKKLQRSFLEGLKRLIQLHLESKYQQPIDLMDIPLQMSVISGAEESDRWNALSDKLDVADKIMAFVSSNQGDTRLMAQVLYDEYLGMTFKEEIDGKKLFPEHLQAPPDESAGGGGTNTASGGGGPSIEDVKAGLRAEEGAEPVAPPEGGEAVPEGETVEEL